MLAVPVMVACGGSGGSEDPPISVYQSLGSRQCIGGGDTLSTLQARLVLTGIQVLAASCGHDGQAYAAVCGGPDDNIGIFDVPSSQLALAARLSFAPLSDLPNAFRGPCP